MRTWVLLLFLMSSAWPAMAAKSVSVGQLEHLLDALHGKSDAKVAYELSDLELTERVSPARLAQWEKDFPGSREHKALIKLVDLAAFLPPSPGDVLSTAAPNREAQEQMLALAAEYVKSTTTQLPNFFATRETEHFEDTPALHWIGSEQTPAGWGAVGGPQGPGGMSATPGIMSNSSDYKPLHYVDTFNMTVTYRDGHEVPDTNADRRKNENELLMDLLTTRKEFGPILSIVIGDSMRSDVTWQRWERGAGDPLAVFRYGVPQMQSHYMVTVPTAVDKKVPVLPGYHGEIAIDPATGAILRLTMVTELPPPFAAMQASMLVEYGSETLGGRNYICPVHGVAIAKIPVVQQQAAATDRTPQRMQTQLNDVVFMGYHLFRSESRILPSGNGTENGPADAEPPEQQP